MLIRHKTVSSGNKQAPHLRDINDEVCSPLNPTLGHRIARRQRSMHSMRSASLSCASFLVPSMIPIPVHTPKSPHAMPTNMRVVKGPSTRMFQPFLPMIPNLEMKSFNSLQILSLLCRFVFVRLLGHESWPSHNSASHPKSANEVAHSLSRARRSVA
jgi:hypothetical protein